MIFTISNLYNALSNIFKINKIELTKIDLTNIDRDDIYDERNNIDIDCNMYYIFNKAKIYCNPENDCLYNSINIFYNNNKLSYENTYYDVKKTIIRRSIILNNLTITKMFYSTHILLIDKMYSNGIILNYKYIPKLKMLLLNYKFDNLIQYIFINKNIYYKYTKILNNNIIYIDKYIFYYYIDYLILKKQKTGYRKLINKMCTNYTISNILI